MLSTTLGPMTSSGLQTSRQSSIGTIIFPPPSMRRLSKPSGECWNHCQSAKKLEVKLTQSKIRYLPEGPSQLSGAITSTYKSLLGVDTSNSAWTQVNSELPKDLRHKRTPATVSFPGGNWDAALSSGNPHGSGMSKCTISYYRAGGRPGTCWSFFLLPHSAPTCISDWILCTSPGDLECFLFENTALGDALQTIQLYRANAIGFLRGGRSSRSVKGKS